MRLGVDQNFVLSGVVDGRVDELLATPLLTAFSPDVGPFTRGVVACTGNEFCRYAVTETKQQAVELAARLDEAIEGRRRRPARRAATPLRIHVSGCSASCAQPQIADVGLRGAVHKGASALLEGYDLGLGGALGPERRVPPVGRGRGARRRPRRRDLGGRGAPTSASAGRRVLRRRGRDAATSHELRDLVRGAT